jgi:dephospho-CoA kinase
MKLIVTVGMPGSGKDELVDVARSVGLATLKMGDLVRAEASRRGISPNGSALSRLAAEEREKHGAAIWAQRALPKLTETKMLVDGCRSDTEITCFRHQFSDLFVLGIFSSPETRYERMRRRGRSDDGSNLQEFFDRDQRELRFGIGSAFILADGMLVNEGDLASFRSAARATITQVLARKA